MAACLPGPAAACRLALLLALDVSSSVDAREYLLQRDGLARALIAPEVQTAFLSSRDPVALAAYEWSGRYNQHIVLDWTLVRGPGDLLAASRRITQVRRSEDEFPTALGYALGHAATLFAAAPACLRRTIDVSGDGVNNDGFAPGLAYRYFPLADVTVNGLVIDQTEGRADLVRYFQREVLRGPGAFVEEAEGYDDFERAMRRKLEREVSSIAVGMAR